MTALEQPPISVVIPTYRRSEIVLETIAQFRQCVSGAVELIIVDQTVGVPPEVSAAMATLDAEGSIRWIRLPRPSIPAAMNRGLLAARGACVLFLDDDIQMDETLVPAHVSAQQECALVAGQVLQPGEIPVTLQPGKAFCFNSDAPCWVSEFMGGNFSVNRAKALALGGFDENFVGAAYRFEAEFAHRYCLQHDEILFAPSASIRHLAISTGGTRAHGHHLRTANSAHSVGAYYFLLRVRPPGWWLQLLWRPVRAVRTRHHLRRPWWIPITLLAELRGLVEASILLARGPRLPFATRK